MNSNDFWIKKTFNDDIFPSVKFASNTEDYFYVSLFPYTETNSVDPIYSETYKTYYEAECEANKLISSSDRKIGDVIYIEGSTDWINKFSFKSLD